MFTFDCIKCGTPFTRKNRRQNKYCSRKCANGDFRGTRLQKKEQDSFISRGYRYIRYEDKWLPEHVVIAMKVLGRPLTKKIVVHHMNGIKTDNRHSNLLICSQSYHTWLHQEMSRRYQQEHFTE